MSWWNPFKTDTEKLNEALKPFANKENNQIPKIAEKSSGEGIADVSAAGFGLHGINSVNTFYSKYLNHGVENEIKRIQEYRSMAAYPEIADVLEDATNEAIQEDDDGKTLILKINDAQISKNNNIVKNLNDEFNKFFYEKLNINHILWDFFFTYLIDGRVFYERIINENKQKEGIVGIKKLPSDTMDFEYDPKNRKNKILCSIS